MPITSCHVAFHDVKNRYSKLKKPIACESSHSFSPIFAVSAFLTKYMASVLPPSEVGEEPPKQNNPQYFNLILEAWNHHLTNCILSGSSYRIDEKLYILVLLPKESFDNLAKDLLFEQSYLEVVSKQSERLQHIFTIPILFYSKRVGMFFNEPVPDKESLTPRKYSCSNLLGSLFNNQTWTIFDIPKGQIPTIEDLIALDAVLVTGSSYSVRDKSPQMQKTVDNLAAALKLAPQLKVVAICYGHQLILHHFGAEVVKKEPIDRLQIIQLRTEVIEKYPALTALHGKKQLLMCQMHEDYVVNVPKGFQLLGSSLSCGVESTISEDGRILTTQFHGQVLYESMKLLFNQTVNRNNFIFKLQQSEERIKSNVKDSMLTIQLMTELLS